MHKGVLKIIFIIILIVFISSYIISSSGYYEYTMQQRTIITNEKIKEFEQDIKDNKEMDLTEYLEKNEISYSNKITNFVYNISDGSNKLARKVMKALFRKLGSLVEEE